MLIALGLNPRRLNQTGAAVLHAQWVNEGWGGEEGKVEAGKEGFTDFPDSKLWRRSSLRPVQELTVSDLEHQSPPSRVEALLHDVLRVRDLCTQVYYRRATRGAVGAGKARRSLRAVSRSMTQLDKSLMVVSPTDSEMLETFSTLV